MGNTLFKPHYPTEEQIANIAQLIINNQPIHHICNQFRTFRPINQIPKGVTNAPTLCSLAIQLNRRSQFTSLIMRGIDPNQVLHTLVQEGKRDFLTYIRSGQKPLNLLQKDRNRNMASIIAIRSGNIEIIRWFRNSRSSRWSSSWHSTLGETCSNLTSGSCRR